MARVRATKAEKEDAHRDAAALAGFRWTATDSAGVAIVKGRRGPLSLGRLDVLSDGDGQFFASVCALWGGYKIWDKRRMWPSRYPTKVSAMRAAERALLSGARGKLGLSPVKHGG